MASLLTKLAADISALDERRFVGRVTGLSGSLIDASGPVDALALGARATIQGPQRSVRGEIVGFRGDSALLAPFDPIDSLRPGAPVALEGQAPLARPSRAWLGRVVDCFGQPVDGAGPLPHGPSRASCARRRPPRTTGQG